MLVRAYWPSMGIKRSRREPNNSPIFSAQEMMHSTKFPLVLRFQLSEQKKVKAVRVSGTEMTVKRALAAMQICTALLL